MKKAVVVGGSSGIGLAISKLLIDRGYYVYICSRHAPEENMLDLRSYEHICLDLIDLDMQTIEQLAADPNVEVLMITAGICRIADFQYFHIAEIEKIMTVDAVSTLDIIRAFYDRIMDQKPFYAGVMGSISGWLSSPSAAVYAAAKAAVVRFVESLNIELEVYGSPNRILDTSPGAFKGSRLYGGENDLSLLLPLAESVLDHMYTRETVFIPQYEELFKSIINRYHSNPHDYGIYSFQYKKESGRVDNTKKVIIGYLSGTFDLFHIGHLNLLRRAKEQCDYLIVGVHDSGKWKGKETFIPFEERKAIVAACKYVDKVVDACVEDSDAWKLWNFDCLFVGSDYMGTERFKKYEEYFKDKSVRIIYFPYTQTTNSTQIRKAVQLKT